MIEMIFKTKKYAQKGKIQNKTKQKNNARSH